MYIPRTIDLHAAGDITTALEQLEHALFQAHQAKENQLRVIYGIGTGVLRGAVLEALRKNPMVIRIEEEDTGGSCIVNL
jgi:dsDNA-specific endonuclease/ATPase MutS2